MNPAMARMARLVVPGIPHHVTQRGNGRARTIFGDDDYALYRDLPAGRGQRPSSPTSNARPIGAWFQRDRGRSRP